MRFSLLGCAIGCVVAATISIEESIFRPSEDEAFVGASSRTLEGRVLNDASKNLVLSARKCRDQCSRDNGCNIWEWCGSVDGCTTADGWEKEKSRYRQCRLKAWDAHIADFPELINGRRFAVGWISGTVRMKDRFGPDATFSGSTCKDKWWGWDGENSMEFLEGTCGAPSTFGPRCKVEDGSEQSCPEQTCKILIDATFDRQKVPVSTLYVDSAEQCCYKCKSKKGCTLYSWCSLFSGCGDGDMQTFRQCWLGEQDAAAPDFPALEKQGEHAEGWISGYIPGYIVWKSQI